MAHIQLDNEMPGIVGLLWTKPATGKPLAKLAQALMKGPSTLSSGEREMIAAYVSSRNDCNFCCNSHSAAAVHYLGGNEALLGQVKQDPLSAPVSNKMKALLAIAGKVQQSGKLVTPADVDNARKAGATDEEVQDTVLIAAAFCMYNRYVDGMGTLEPEDKSEYKDMGKRMAKKGYGVPPGFLRRLINRKRNKDLQKKKA
jgi:uncharacterized peroxidase-related enzyme